MRTTPEECSDSLLLLERGAVCRSMLVAAPAFRDLAIWIGPQGPQAALEGGLSASWACGDSIGLYETLEVQRVEAGQFDELGRLKGLRQGCVIAVFSGRILANKRCPASIGIWESPYW